MGSISEPGYSSLEESRRILDYLLTQFNDESLPPAAAKDLKSRTTFTADRDAPYFPIPFKETETTAALKAVEGSIAGLLADIKQGADGATPRKVNINLEKTTAFLCQAYLATVGGRGKLDPKVKALLKGNYRHINTMRLLRGN
jgi:hypothetical protein